MRALSSNEIEDRLKSVDGFEGVFSSDNLPKKIPRIASGVINLDSSDGPGTHWVCYYNDPFSKVVEYYDSFGIPPSTLTQKYLKTSGKKIRYQTNPIQNLLSSACGYYCIDYIKNRAKGISPIDVVYAFEQSPLPVNEAILQNSL